MARKQIYIRDADMDIWERAEKIGGENNLSALVTEAVRHYVEQKEAEREAAPYKRIQIVIAKFDHGTPIGTRKVAFYGRELADGMEAHGYLRVTAYKTKNEQILIYYYSENDSLHNDYIVYEDFEALKKAVEDSVEEDRKPSGQLLNDIADALNEEFIEELDV